MRNLSHSLRAKRDVLWSRVRRSEKTPWIMACTFAVVLAVVLGIPLGWRFRGKELNIGLDTDWEGRFVSAIFKKKNSTYLCSTTRFQLATEVTLISADATAGTATFQWYIYSDTCIINALKSGDDITDDNCPLVNIFLDP